MWSLLDGFLGLQCCQDIIAWACVGDLNQKGVRPVYSPGFFDVIFEDTRESISIYYEEFIKTRLKVTEKGLGLSPICFCIVIERFLQSVVPS